MVQRLGCKEYLGIDIAEAAVERLRAKFPDYQFQAGDLSREPIPGKWDVILMVHVDEHVHGKDFMKAMTTIKEAMKPTSNFLASASHPDKKAGSPTWSTTAKRTLRRCSPSNGSIGQCTSSAVTYCSPSLRPPHPTRDAVSLVDLT